MRDVQRQSEIGQSGWLGVNGTLYKERKDVGAVEIELACTAHPSGPQFLQYFLLPAGAPRAFSHTHTPPIPLVFPYYEFVLTANNIQSAGKPSLLL